MGKLTKDEAVGILKEAKSKLETAATKDEALGILKDAGGAVGYKPAFRALVAGVEPEKSVKWD